MTREEAKEIVEQQLEGLINNPLVILDERYIEAERMAIKALSEQKTEAFDKMRSELHATAEMHEDGYYYLRDEWIDEIIDKYRKGEGE